MQNSEKYHELTEKVIGCAMEVHRQLGPGLLESVYHRCLCHELSLAGIAYVTEHVVPLEYKGLRLSDGFRLDLLIEDRLVVEIKAVTVIESIHEAQLLSYMRLARKPVGLLINFHSALLKDGIRRRLLNH